jgi:hypothetical protein
MSHPNDYKTQKTQFALFNLVLNALVSGIGSMSNKKYHNINLKGLMKRFYKGAIGECYSSSRTFYV